MSARASHGLSHAVLWLSTRVMADADPAIASSKEADILLDFMLFLLSSNYHRLEVPLKKNVIENGTRLVFQEAARELDIAITNTSLNPDNDAECTTGIIATTWPPALQYQSDLVPDFMHGCGSACHPVAQH